MGAATVVLNSLAILFRKEADELTERSLCDSCERIYTRNEICLLCKEREEMSIAATHIRGRSKSEASGGGSSVSPGMAPLLNSAPQISGMG